jgi:hypothetical protein
MGKNKAERNPSGWYLKCDVPADLDGLIEWLAIRTALLHEYLAGRFDVIEPAIRRELPDSANRAGILSYVWAVVAHVHCWLEHHEICGQPAWFSDRESLRRSSPDNPSPELIRADEHLSAMFNWLRSYRHGEDLPANEPVADNLPDGCSVGPGCRSAKWFGETYSFTGNQGKCIEILLAAFCNGTFDVSDHYLLMEAEISSGRLDHLFSSRRGGRHPAWGTMIVRGKSPSRRTRFRRSRN